MPNDLTLAQANAFSLAETLKVPVVLFQAGDVFGVMVASEYDGDDDAILHEFDPWSPAH